MSKRREVALCYIVHEDSGQYDEFRSTPVVVFRVEAVAIAERDRRNALADEFKQILDALWESSPPTDLPDAEFAVLHERHSKREAALVKRRVRLLGSEEFDGVFSIREVPFSDTGESR